MSIPIPLRGFFNAAQLHTGGQIVGAWLACFWRAGGIEVELY